MASIRHSVTVAGTNDPAKQVSVNAWNDDHIVSLALADVTGLTAALAGKQDVLGFTPYNSTNPSAYISSINSSMVTTALGYTPTSVTGLTGSQTVSAFKTGLSLVKADVGLGSVDNTADAAKAVLSATKLTTSRTLAGTGDVAWSGSFDGSANFSVTTTIQAGTVTLAKMANMATASVIYRKTAGTGAPEVQTLATLKTDLALTGTNSGDQTITLTGDATGSGTGSFSVAVGKINGVSLASLATGILKNTTTTGAPSIAIAADFPTLNQSTTGSAATLTTPRNIDGQAFNGSANITVVAPGTHAATSKATPVDADEIPLVDSAASNVLAKLTWANLKATLKTYLDTLYGVIPPAWTVTTPTPTPSSGAFTTASSVIHAVKNGKSVSFSANVTITTIGTAPAEGAAGFCDVALPFASVASIYQSFGGRENGVTGKGMGATILPGSTTLRFQRYDGTAMHGNGYVLTVTGIYEAA